MVQAAMGPSSQAVISKTTVVKELGFDPEAELKNREEDLKISVEMAVREAEGQAEAMGAASLINASYAADAQIENANRMEQGQQESAQKRDTMRGKQKAINAEGVAQEVQMFAQNRGADTSQMSLPNFILNLTQRFARLTTMFPDEFKIRMLAMKNAMPSLYQEIYQNLKEMNLIAADVMPDLQMAQAVTPGELPAYSQGGSSAEDQPSPAELGASPEAVEPVATPINNPIKPLPAQKPPRSPNAPI